MKWTSAHTEGLDDLYEMLTDSRRASLDAKAASLFVQLKILDIIGKDWPETVAGLCEDQSAQLRQLAMNLEALEGLTTINKPDA